ncbi:hypothetical protein E8E13_003311 [Curvularia kusanoi]|uniref:Heterokaryon incompatibility domain-containing protein n=1 Tax=Curvularia kusanoi TaxID=90978 RepID=A0A9P4TBP5_CURKU|nr:hypothetical protein E8E13_003311 [Curvularia kusanoi]
MPPYAALSYCWGQTPQQEQAKSVNANIQDRQKNIDPSQLPQTVRDAIRVARALTLSFLWVDALCIIQDDKSEMQTEITKMAGVYQNAAITIVAASAKSSVEGFLGDRDLKAAYGQVSQLSYEFINGDHQAQGSVMLSERSLRDEYEEPIDTRAWTMQEDILSVRLLRFGLTQTTWRCPSVYKTIDGGSSPSLHFEGFNFTKSGAFQDKDHKLTESEYRSSNGNAYVDNEVWKVWQGSIEDYTTRAISNPEDRLTACAAFAEKFASTRSLCSTDYLSGLWKDDIYAQLLWYQEEESDVARSSGSRRSPAPTWSWASINGPVHFHNRYLLTDENDVVQASARLDDDRMLYRRQGCGYAEVGPACLWLNGTLQRVHRDGHHVKQGMESASPLALTAFWDSPEDQFDQTLWCFEVTRTAQGNRTLGLLLARTEREEFVRVGCFETDDPSVRSWLAKDERRTVAIV